MKVFITISLITVLCITLFVGCTGGRKNTDKINLTDAKSIYVSTKGSDENDGTKENPVKSVGKAQELVRLYNGDSNVIVHIEKGEYYLSETLKFTPDDGGKNGYSVSYVGDSAVFSGGVKITDWTLYDSEKNIYKAEDVDFDFAQLYVDGKKAVRAKNVHLGDAYSMRIIKAYREETTEDGVTYPANCITVDKNAVGDWVNVKDIKLKLLMAWTDNTLPVESIGYIGDRAVIKIQSPCAERIFNRPHPDIVGYAGVTEFVCWFENAYEFIDEEGEWYLDTDAKALYYKAPEGTDMSKVSVVAPKTETLLSIEGTEEKSVENLTFSGIEFCCSNWTHPNEEGLVGGQASQYVLTSNLQNEVGVYRTPSAVYASWTNNVSFIRNRFSNLGATALDYHTGNKGGLIEGNIIADVSGNGINVGKFVCDDLHDYHDPYNPEDEREICDGQIIRNNFITRIGTDYEGSVGIGGGYPKNLLIENNTMSFMPYSAISVGYGWTSEDNAMSSNIIRRNNIHDVCLSVCDGAAVYTLSKQPQSEITENFIHDYSRHPWFDYDCAGIYLDEQTEGFKIQDNVMINCPGIWEHLTGENKLKNNGEFYDEKIIMGSGVSEEYRDILPESEIVIMPEAPLSMKGWKAEAFSTMDGASVSDALEFDSGTRWISGANQEVGSWFMIDMKKEQTISRLNFTGSIGDNPDYPSDCDILLSKDGESWETVSQIRDNNEVTIETEFPETEARYIKIVIIKAREAWWDIRTVRVY